MQLNKTIYKTEMQVRPDDIDMFQHVHSSRYIDYVLAARYDQMGKFYKMPMNEFLEHGFGWVINSTTIHFKRPLKLGDSFLVKTNLDDMQKTGCTVKFSIVNNFTHKICCDGVFHYTMINLKSGAAEIIPQWIIDRYSNHG
ncbi:MAG: acyl-CoA thioesterase [Bacteroidia bacterium]